jgi:hypothetical protein
MTVKNTAAYYNMELIMSVKGFILSMVSMLQNFFICFRRCSKKARAFFPAKLFSALGAPLR